MRKGIVMDDEGFKEFVKRMIFLYIISRYSRYAIVGRWDMLESEKVRDEFVEELMGCKLEYKSYQHPPHWKPFIKKLVEDGLVYDFVYYDSRVRKHSIYPTLKTLWIADDIWDLSTKKDLPKHPCVPVIPRYRSVLEEFEEKVRGCGYPDMLDNIFRDKSKKVVSLLPEGDLKIYMKYRRQTLALKDILEKILMIRRKCPKYFHRVYLTRTSTRLVMGFCLGINVNLEDIQTLIHEEREVLILDPNNGSPILMVLFRHERPKNVVYEMSHVLDDILKYHKSANNVLTGVCNK